jgi:hypothetical protein
LTGCRLQVATGWRCDGLADGQGQVVDISPGMAAGGCCKLVGPCAAARQGRSAMRQGDFPAMARCRHYGRHGQAEGPAGPGSTAPSPDEGGGGLTLVQLLPAAEPASRHRHRRALLGQCRLSSSPWPATAGPAPPPAARCRAPGIAGRRGCRTVVRGRGTPGSASRRSGECTDGGRRASASTCSCGPSPTRSRARWRSPRAGASSGRSRRLTALAWLPGSDQPTKQRGMAKPEPHRGSTVLPAGRACRARSGAGRVLGHGSLPADQVGVRAALPVRAGPPGLAG